jgi:hypothetical protein
MENNISDTVINATDKVANGLDKVFTTTVHGIEQLYSVLQKVAPHVWELAVKQQVIDGCFSIAFSVVIILIIYFYLDRITSKAIANLCNYKGEVFGFSLLKNVILTVAYGFLIYCAFDGISHILNPEYYALMDLAKNVSRVYRGGI